MKRVAIAAAALLLTACSSSGGDGRNSGGGLHGTITVYAAASLTEAFDTIKVDFVKAHPGTTIKAQYGASSELATQITQGARADVFAAASGKPMQTVVDAGDAVTPTDFVAYSLAIAVPPGNPGHITTLADLAGPGIKVAVCDPEVPCGAVAKTVLGNAKLAIKPKVNAADVKATLAAVESKEVDAGLVYVTDVRSAADKVKGIEIPDSVNASTTYPIATLTHSGNADLAKAFVAYVLSPAGKRALAADGFVAP
jgi:molybdate transport system substrate-binding protein